MEPQMSCAVNERSTDEQGRSKWSLPLCDIMESGWLCGEGRRGCLSTRMRCVGRRLLSGGNNMGQVLDSLGYTAEAIRVLREAAII